MKRNADSGRVSQAVTFVATAAGLLLAGCASPGPPRPPSLRLPDIVTTLEGDRIGDEIELRWTTPSATTDRLAIKGGMTAILCREDAPFVGKKTACTPIRRFAVTPGPTTAVDALPGNLLAEPPRLIAYRLELLNAKGHSAGPSAETYALAGAAPRPVADLKLADAPGGLRIEWRKDAAPVQVSRTLIADATGAAPKAAAAKSTGPSQPSQNKQPVEVTLGAGDTDSGGMVDTSAVRLATYRYVAQRIRTVTIAGQKLKLRSPQSAAIEHVVRDTFPPPVPVGLVVIPGFGGSASVDLSWQPVEADDLAGYLVYRKTGRTGETWTKLTTEPTSAASYRDTTAVAGVNYAYRVTSVDQSGNASAPCVEVKVNPEP